MFFNCRKLKTSGRETSRETTFEKLVAMVNQDTLKVPATEMFYGVNCA
jgi:hypothetical protein